MPTSFEDLTKKEFTTWVATRTKTGQNPSIANGSVMTRRRTGNRDETLNWKTFYQEHGYLPVNYYDTHYREATLMSGNITWDTKSSCGGGRTTILDSFRVNDNLDTVAGLGSYSLDDSAFSSLRATAISRANGKLRDQSMALGETLVELNKTRNMIVDTVSRITQTAIAIRRRDFAKAAMVLGLKKVPANVGFRKPFANNWLAYRYGWLPLYSEVYGSMEAFYKWRRSARLIRSVVGYSHNVADIESTSPHGSWTSYDPSINYSTGGTGAGSSWSTPLTIRTRRDKRYWRTCSVGYVYEVTNPTMSMMSTLGIDNPLLLSWELLPMSFVADWFLNVSDVLGQFGLWNANTFLTGWETRTYIVKQTARTEVVSVNTTSCYNGYYQALVYPAVWERRDVMQRRVVLTQPPMFGFHLDNGLSNKRLIDSVALLRQRMR